MTYRVSQWCEGGWAIEGVLGIIGECGGGVGVGVGADTDAESESDRERSRSRSGHRCGVGSECGVGVVADA